MLIPLEQAQDYVFSRCSTLRATSIEIANALGLYTAEHVYAREPIPPFDNTAVDGFALHFEDTVGASPTTEITFEVLGTLAAGEIADRPVGPRQAYRIMTGAPLPVGADAIVMIEDSRSFETSEAKEGSASKVAIVHEVKLEENIRRTGSDLAASSEVFTPHTRLTPSVIGVLASIGMKKVTVFPRPRVGVISTGNELSDEEELPLGKIRDSNRPALLAALRSMGADAIDLGTCVDERESLKTGFLDAARSCDAIVTSGGVSVGDFDLTKVVLDELSGGEMRWMQVAIKPAKPFAFGLIDGTPLFGLPGNPVSALVSFELFARPAILGMMGASRRFRRHLWAVAEEPLRRSEDGKVHFFRAVLSTNKNNELLVRSAGGQFSHILSALANSDGLAILPNGEGIKAGDSVEVMLLD